MATATLSRPAAAARDVSREIAVPAAGAALALRGLAHAFGDRAVLTDVSLDAAPGELVAVVGRSGCGKTTLLRIVAGLQRAAGPGEALLDGIPITGIRQDARMVFQEPRLLPWRTVADNVALGFPRGRATPAAIAEALHAVGLAGHERDWPGTLSGGQRQRVALARAILSRPRLLLLDEPLGALDALTRLDMQRLLEDLWLSERFTALLVTHDVEEAVALADRVVVLEAGRVVTDLRVELPRPRAREAPAFVALVARVLGRLLER